MINTFGENTVRIRCEKNISRRKLAALSGVTEQALVNIEFGRKVPRETTKIKIARALDCEVDELERTYERNYSFATVSDVASCLFAIQEAVGASHFAFEWDEDKTNVTLKINQKDLCQAIVSKAEITTLAQNQEINDWAHEALCTAWLTLYNRRFILEK